MCKAPLLPPTVAECKLKMDTNTIKVVNLERKGERQIQESNLVKFATTFV